MKFTRFVKVAYEESKKSTHRHKLGAVIFKHGKIIAKGYNKTNRGHAGNYGHWSGSLHAELAAIISARTNLVGSTLLVARTNGRLAKPCECCMAAIKEAGIKCVWFTTEKGLDKVRVV